MLRYAFDIEESNLPFVHLAGEAGRVPFVFLNGYQQTYQFMMPYAREVNQRGNSAMLWDYPGQLDLTGRTEDFTIDGLSSRLIELYRAAGINGAILFGYSLGGIIALYHTLKYPDSVEGLFIVSATHAGKMVGEGRIRPEGRAWTYSRTNQLNLPLFRLYRDVLYFNADPEKINVPVLAVGAKNDPFCPEEAFDEFVGRLPNARHIKIRGEDHRVISSKEDEIITFLRKNYEFLIGE